MFISFYIADTKNALIFQYLLSSSSPLFSHLLTKIQNVCPELISEHHDEERDESIMGQDSLKYTSSIHSSLGKDLEVYKYHSVTNNINYFCLTSLSKGQASIEPLLFLENMDRILLEYFEKERLTVSKLINNHDRLSMIFYMCVDSGEPAVGRLHENMIKRMVPMRSDLSKIINSTAHSFQKAVRQPALQNQRLFEHSATKGSLLFEQGSGSSTNDAFENEVVPWRTGNLKYKDNEIYVDVLETMHLVYSQRQKKRRRSYRGKNETGAEIKMVCGSICGQINFRSHISENPTIELDLNLAGNYLGVPSLHESVETSSEPGKPVDKLRFIPPDGKFCLMEYNIDLDMLQARNAVYKSGSIGMVSVDFQDGLGSKHDEFEIIINISNSTKVTDIKDLRIDVEVTPEVMPRNNTTDERSNKNKNQEVDDPNPDFSEHKIKVLRNTHGRFENDVVPGKGTWIFQKDTAVGALPVLRGCVENVWNSAIYVKVKRVSVSYNYAGELASGIQVNAINITSGVRNLKSLKLFKGVKYTTASGDFVIRG
ncbi:hypothetical protein HG535_0D03850 [Zygotorulaspora mrakii]|uniref:MHD domain-containing protein n=1 Tax=Zygotorulaspora mrakii TaxID=42260 RepID=A0A7H9B2G2_ZYGMR|nr:uncharacterized protein HG535_0D03850 [Zygotorulaspora mrakii]QLG72677.1 hypothetical protein HG535_0D03850 [Zygotorulaspora mrakii]